MTAYIAAFSVGVIILYCVGVLLPWYYYIFAVLPLVLSLTARPSLWLACVIFGLAYASYEANKHQQSVLPAALEGIEVRATGYLCSLPIAGKFSTRAEFCVVQIARLNGQVLAFNLPRLLIRWSSELQLQPQRQLLDLTLVLTRPRGTVNVVGHSYEQYLFAHRVSALAKVVASASVTPVTQSLTGDTAIASSLTHQIQSSLTALRYQLKQHIYPYLEHYEHAGLIIALILGDRGLVTVADNRHLSATGTQHLMAISGLHVGLLMWLLFRILPNSWLGSVLMATASLLYICLVGFGASAQRAWIMGMLATMAVAGRLRYRLRAGLVSALFFVLLLDPLAPMSLGFWYSFFSVFVILVLVRLKLSSASMWGLLGLQCLLILMLGPLNAWFGLPQVGLSGVANLFAIPWVSLVVLPLVLLSTLLSFIEPVIAGLGFLIANEILHALMALFDELANLPTGPFIIPSSWLNAVFLLLMFVSLVLFRMRRQSMFFIVVLVLFLLIPGRRNDQHFMHLFDSGQGLAMVFHSADDTWLYDTGPSFERSSVMGRAVLPFLRQLNSGHDISGLILSHGDQDHSGGLATLLQHAEPLQFWAGEPERANLLRVTDSSAIQQCRKGMVWQQGKMHLEVLFPDSAYLGRSAYLDRSAFPGTSANNRSCVVMLSLAGLKVLLMGDLEGKGERYFLRSTNKDLRADILIAGHHGSKNASSYALLKRVEPELVVFSAGYRNRFGHPHADVIERLQQVGSQYLSTAESGALTVQVDGAGGKQISLARQGAPFWIQTAVSGSPFK